MCSLTCEKYFERQQKDRSFIDPLVGGYTGGGRGISSQLEDLTDHGTLMLDLVLGAGAGVVLWGRGDGKRGDR